MQRVSTPLMSGKTDSPSPKAVLCAGKFPGGGRRLARSESFPTCRVMGAINGKPLGRPPHKNSKEAPPQAGDELGAYSYSQLMRMDEKFRERMTRAIERGLERSPEDPVRAAAC